MDQLKVNSTIVKLTRGDIVTAGTEAIVNAANEGLWPGSGVCGAIYLAAGPGLERFTSEMGGCPTGQAKITPAFSIPRPTTHIIHAVGPRYGSYPKEKARELLAGAYSISLELAEAAKLKSIAFPSLSTGIYAYPITLAAPVALETVLYYLRSRKETGQSQAATLQEVKFVLWTEKDLEVFRDALEYARG